MPEMLPFCGQTFRVALRAERTCAYPPEVPFRKLEGTVVLAGLRCDGGSHGGCQLGCMMLWKERWLRKVDGPSRTPGAVEEPRGVPDPILRVKAADDAERWVCQATEVRRATTPGDPLWSPGQYLGFLRHRTLTPAELGGMCARMGLRSAMRLRRSLLPARITAEPERDVPPLRPGEWVDVKSYDEIAATLDEHRAHKGLSFGAEMVEWCGRRARVRERIERIINEATGQMRQVRDTVTLEGAVCDRYLACGRGMPLLFRTAWLRRAAPSRSTP